MTDRPASAHPDMLWSGWGDPAAAVTLTPDQLTLLGGALGLRGPGLIAPAIEEVRLTPSVLPGTVRERLTAIAGAEHVLDDDVARARHTRGKSTFDLLRQRAGDLADAPDAVVLPGTHDEVVAILQACSEARVAVVPFGGGTSVVGGLEPARAGFDGVIALDLRRLDRLVALDEVSRTATLEAGLRGPQAEALLGARGFTIGHHPQSFEYATIGGFAAARSSGQASAGYGRFDERVVGMTVATPTGTIELGRAPKSAAGPDLRQLFLGSEGVLGVITSVIVEVRPVPVERVYEGWRFASFAQGTAALRALAQDGPLPTVVRLSDEAETAVNLTTPSELLANAAGGCLAITGYEGTPEEVAGRRERASAVLRELGGEHDPTAGQHWARDRYKGPYLRDALLDAGALVETVETTTFWSGIERLYTDAIAALRSALEGQGTPPIILGHISHVYPSGASVYLTVAAAQLEDPIAQWSVAKRAVSDAILEAGGSITHHHAIGIDHREHYLRQIGPVAAGALRAVKADLDPAGILNPGVLLG